MRKKESLLPSCPVWLDFIRCSASIQSTCLVSASLDQYHCGHQSSERFSKLNGWNAPLFISVTLIQGLFLSASASEIIARDTQLHPAPVRETVWFNNSTLMLIVTMARSVVQRGMGGTGGNLHGCCGRPLGTLDLMGPQDQRGKACIMSGLVWGENVLFIISLSLIRHDPRLSTAGCKGFP